MHVHRTKRLFPVLLGLALVALAAGTASAQTKVTDSKFQYNGFNYFRGSAEDVVLASYGEKKTPVGKTHYLQRQDDIGRANLGKVTVTVSGPYNIDWESYTATDVNANISYLTAAGVTGSFSRQKAIDADLKLVKFSMSVGQQEKLLNDFAGTARNWMKDEGGDARIVGSVWVVMEASIATTIKNCGSITGAGAVSGFKVSIDVNKCTDSASSVDIPPGTTFAYGLYKVKKWNKGKTKVEELEDDQAGLN
jgi:hypothetical protein